MTQGILVLIGTLLGGVLVMINQHFQAKRDDRRQQRTFERAVRSEPLERIKHAVDIGLRMVTLLNEEADSGRMAESAISLVPEASLAFNGAYISATTQELRDELSEFRHLMDSFVRAIEVGTFDQTLFNKSADLLTRIETQYLELKIGAAR